MPRRQNGVNCLTKFDWKALGAPLKPVTSGYEAAQACMELMRRAQAMLPPETICETYNALGGGKGSAVIQGLGLTSAQRPSSASPMEHAL